MNFPGGKQVQIEFIQHALDRMTERGVTENEVIACLRSPDQRGLVADEPNKRVSRVDGNAPRRSLHEVYIPFGPEHFRVVTVYWLRTGA